MNLTFETMREPFPGPRMQGAADRFWPAYRRWLLAGGGLQAASTEEAVRRLRRAMPELMPAYDALREIGPDDPLFARFLTLYRPPAFIGACSMAVADDGAGPILVRNYDFDPALAEGIVLDSRWNGRRVLGMADCLWGLVDGVNGDGLAVALTFGGRKSTGDGFGIPLILRYVLETCRDVRDGVEALRAVPSHMAYNVGLVDRAGDHAMVHLAPGGGATLARGRVATNHQGRIHWPAHARFSETVERAGHLRRLLRRKKPAGGLADAFLDAPLYRTQYGAGFGTLYTSVLDPGAGTLTCRWPGQSLTCHIGDVDETSVDVRYVDGRGASADAGHGAAGTAPPEAFEVVVDSIAAALSRGGRPFDRAALDRLRREPVTSWARLGEIFIPAG